MAEPITITGLAALLISNIGIWIREWRKGRNEKSGNGDIKEIKQKTECIDKKVGEIKGSMTGIEASINAMKENCQKTTSRFDAAINENRKEILDMAKSRQRK